jgi:hypothetical protein
MIVYVLIIILSFLRIYIHHNYTLQIRYRLKPVPKDNYTFKRDLDTPNNQNTT